MHLKPGIFPPQKNILNRLGGWPKKTNIWSNANPALLRLLGTTYLGMRRQDKAVESFTKALEFEKPNCGADSDYPARCADAQVDLATALSVKGDLSSALTLSESAVDEI